MELYSPEWHGESEFYYCGDKDKNVNDETSSNMNMSMKSPYHTVRKTSIGHLLHADIPSNYVAQLSGPKNLKSGFLQINFSNSTAQNVSHHCFCFWSDFMYDFKHCWHFDCQMVFSTENPYQM